MKLAKAPLWDIAEHPIYILGTVHAGPFGGFRFPHFADGIIGTQDVGYFELDPFAHRDMSSMLRAPSSPSTLSGELGGALYRRLQEEEHQFANPLDAHVAGAIAEILAFLAARRGAPKYWEDWGVDRFIWNQYRAGGKDVRALETAASQLQAILTGPIGEIVAELEAWSATGKLPRHDGEFVDDYFRGDFEAIGKLRGKLAPFRPSQTRAMLHDREARWVEKVKEIGASGTRALVAVGVLHLPGEDGLLAQLRKAGYTVRFLGEN